ncbi:hypothetical protein HTZ77_17435 [Nonomuraea sp. SMC257]|uniref:GyrI-like small molecule binding domain-containing protein n=1 Tax=Nonomuraea montanisoli TaxID=2741721 RepID=A0A7Y6I875_9ACTN|nr:hypothetical protein [Nonomuraea montanisoli]NUW33201.1 hypothetical protein [Nonomuraea montanisoli]
MLVELKTYGPATCLSVTGMGAPGGAEHVAAIGALFAVAGGMGGPAGPLEGLWWVEDPRPGLEVERELWRWHLMLPAAGALEPGALESARELVRSPGSAVDRVRVVTYTEGLCVEALHLGPFSEEYVTLKAMEEFMAERGLVVNGPHHEVYLTPLDDPEPRTVLRQPVRQG